MQGTSYDSEFMVAGAEQTGPDSSVDFELVVLAGGGVNMRLWGDVVLGAAISWIGWGRDPRAIEGGVYIGYGWYP